MIDQLVARCTDFCHNLIGTKINGKDGVMWLKNSGTPDWRQMEWQGFYYEHTLRNALFNGETGPFESDAFDRELGVPIEIKSHWNMSKSKEILLNSVENTNQIIEKYNEIFVINVFYDGTPDYSGDFRNWHHMLKGGNSTNYVGAYHRLRKADARVTSIKFFPLNADLLKVCGIMRRNGNEKYKISLSMIDKIGFTIQ